MGNDGKFKRKNIKIEPELLLGLYWGNGHSLKKIGELFGCSSTLIRNRMNVQNIPIMDKITCQRKYELIEPELLWALYWGNYLNQSTIGDIFKYPTDIIGWQMEKYEIPTRNGYFTKEIKIEKGLLLALYHGNMYSQSEIAGMFNVTHGCILKEMRRLNIPSRPYSESNKLSDNSGKFGKLEKHPNWIDGRSFEPYSLEFNKQLKRQIRKRDKFTCQECGMTQDKLGYTLHVHHINYDKKDNSMNNLISLCHQCHCQTNFNRSDWMLYYENKLKLSSYDVCDRVI